MNEKLSQMEQFTEAEQKQKIEEMNEIVDGMNKEEFESVFNTELFDKIFKMIEEKKMTMENALLLLKHAGYCKVLLNLWSCGFYNSLLRGRFEKMIVDEDEKIEKNEKLLADLCECNLCFSFVLSLKLISICVPCLLKVASKKEENKETQKEAEFALYSLSNIGMWGSIGKKLYLNEIKEIITHHQKHHNLTRLEYQLAWKFLIDRYHFERSLEDLIVNELHFAREAAKELDELRESVDWKERKFETRNLKEIKIIESWIIMLRGCYYYSWFFPKEESKKLTISVANLCRAAKKNYRKTYKECIYYFFRHLIDKAEHVDYLREEVIDFLLGELHQPTIDNEVTGYSENIFRKLSEILKSEKEKVNGVFSFVWIAWNKLNGKAKQKMMFQRKMFEKMEEDGYEDIVVSFYRLALRRYLNLKLISDFEDFFISR
ncbi:uncharacterized protein MONOS_16520 [Monocercomonoides exilis]|uniref:uncharacterized protein n=1 Tax=Monocercomonoides exilis TaxID=2049356 RepID=UPI003559975C|nr:hypothetical protein MONOS_16520 [Monocercomonoides exilis]